MRNKNVPRFLHDAAAPGLRAVTFYSREIKERQGRKEVTKVTSLICITDPTKSAVLSNSRQIGPESEASHSKIYFT